MKNDYLTISDINKYIKNIINNDLFLNKVYIKGEISNFKYHTRGHLYFSLKDENSKINAVMFNSSREKLNFIPKDGDSVLITGKINVYESSGTYQVYVDKMEQDGEGNLYVIFEKLKKELSDAGYFDEEHKKPIPKMPEKLGVITASTGAAIKDIISTINRRYPLVELYLFPTLVQGVGAKENIVQMIEKADTYNLDVIILGRGGGSIEDLWAFNEQIVAKAVYNASTPIISAVGHEIDFTICDFVADVRAATPTAAAELAVPSKDVLLDYLDKVKERLDKTLTNKIDNYEAKLSLFKNNYLLNNPTNIYIQYEQKLDTMFDKNNNNIKRIIELNKNIINNLAIKIELLSPNNILKKGYCLCYLDNKLINENEINKGDNLTIKTINKEILSTVKEVKDGKTNI